MTIAFPDFHAAHCVRFRFRYSDCRRCADACPHEAVELSDAGIAINEARCQNCGLCTSACRTGALASANLPRIDLLRRAIKQPGFSFACAPSQENADAVVPCLGALDSVMLAYLAKRRIPVELRGSHLCPDCPHGEKGADQLALNLDGVRVLRAGAQDEEWSDIRLPVPEGTGSPAAPGARAARRQLFRRLIGRGVDAVAEVHHRLKGEPVPDRAIRAGPYVFTDQRELLAIVAKMPESKTFMVPRHPALPLAELELAEGCTVCEACFRACPTGAISLDESPTSWALVFRADRCVGCEVCAEVCQPGVLGSAEVTDATPGRPRQILHALSKQRCARCDRFFASPEPRDLCAICFDDEEAFGQIFG